MARKRDPLKRGRIAAVLMNASRLISGRGHCIGALKDDSGRLCVMGAIRLAADGETREIKYAAYDAVNAALRRPLDQWNDEQTDYERVAGMLEGTARDIDPAVEAKKLCWHGIDIDANCGDCRWQSERRRLPEAWERSPSQ